MYEERRVKEKRRQDKMKYLSKLGRVYGLCFVAMMMIVNPLTRRENYQGAEGAYKHCNEYFKHYYDSCVTTCDVRAYESNTEK